MIFRSTTHEVLMSPNVGLICIVNIYYAVLHLMGEYNADISVETEVPTPRPRPFFSINLKILQRSIFRADMIG